MKKYIETKNAPKAIGPYSQAILVDKILYCSGQIAIDPKNQEFINGDIKEQTNQVIKNIDGVLSEAGLGFKDVVKTTCFLSDMKYFQDFNEIYEKHFISKPARSTVAAKELPKNALVEVEVIAHKED